MPYDKMGGMRIGKGHNWKYKHTKTKDSGRRFTIHQIKTRNRPSPRGSGMPVNSRLHWGINATENVKRVNRNLYKVTLTGIKRQKAFSTKRWGKMIKPRRSRRWVRGRKRR